jgi:hypothetical protein
MRAALSLLIPALLVCSWCGPVVAQQTPADEVTALKTRLKEATEKLEAEEEKADAPAKAGYLKELEKIRDAAKAKAQLDALIEVEGTIKAVTDGTDAPKPKILAAALGAARANYDKAHDFALRQGEVERARIGADYDKAIGALEIKFTQAGNVEAAKAAREARRILLTVDARVDGPSTLFIRRDGLYWVNGNNGKPGPVYVDGRRWDPRWTKPDQGRGQDRSEAYRIPILPSTNLKITLVGVRKERTDEGIDQRTPIDIKSLGSEIRILIPDPEAGTRWYKFIFKAN